MDLADFNREAVFASFLAESEEGLGLMEQALVQMEVEPVRSRTSAQYFPRRAHASRETQPHWDSVNWRVLPTS